MLKKFKNSDIDIVMNLWKKEYFSNHKKMKQEDLTREYTNIKNMLLDKKSTTILYTEEDVIEGFISFNESGEIFLVYVDAEIRREGIGTVLVDACKNKCNSLLAKVNQDNGVGKKFFQKNEFEKTVENDEEIYVWKNSNKEKTSIIYFDDDIDEKLDHKDSNVIYRQVELRSIANNKEIKDVKTYLKVKKTIESEFKGKSVLLYINYNNYYAHVDDIIKEIAKISKAKFGVIISEPLVMENFKYKDKINEIEQSYKSYKVYKIDIENSIKEDISVNKILDEKMKVIMKKIEEIAEIHNA